MSYKNVSNIDKFESTTYDNRPIELVAIIGVDNVTIRVKLWTGKYTQYTVEKHFGFKLFNNAHVYTSREIVAECKKEKDRVREERDRALPIQPPPMSDMLF